MADTVELVGLSALRRDFDRLTLEGGALENALSAAALPAAAPIASATSGAIPSDSGDLAASVTSGRTRTGAKVRVGGGLDYAGPVDFGGWPGDREYVGSGRYLFPAASSLEGAAVEAYSHGAQTALDSFSWTNTGSSVHD